MSRNKAILDGSDVVRRDHLRRLAQGPGAIAHLVPDDDGRDAIRQQLVEAVSSIGEQNRAAARRAARRKARSGDKA